MKNSFLFFFFSFLFLFISLFLGGGGGGGEVGCALRLRKCFDSSVEVKGTANHSGDL